MATGSKKRKSTGSKKRFIGKPTGQMQERVQTSGPEHFRIIAVDCALAPIEMDVTIAMLLWNTLAAARMQNG